MVKPGIYTMPVYAVKTLGLGNSTCLVTPSGQLIRTSIVEEIYINKDGGWVRTQTGSHYNFTFK
jgi:hypothetical protein